MTEYTVAGSTNFVACLKGLRGLQGALNRVLGPLLLLGYPGFSPNFKLFLMFGPGRAPPFYVAGKVTNPYGFVIGKPPILKGPQKWMPPNPINL
jgi:hypothetical protein